MKRLFEFKVFDVVNDKDNEEFLKKVKEQNPDLYGNFVSIIGNKGLQFAMDKYKEHDPDYWKIQNKELTKQTKLQSREEKIHDTLKAYEKEINTINVLLENSQLYEFLDFIKKNQRISEYLLNCHSKKQYSNLFLKILKKPLTLRYKLGYTTAIDRLSFIQKMYPDSFFDEGDSLSVRRIIRIDQYFNTFTNKLTYSIYFNMPEEFFAPAEDHAKKDQFIEKRNEQIHKLGKNGINKKEVYEILQRFEVLLSPEAYQGWYEKWEMYTNANKYNL